MEDWDTIFAVHVRAAWLLGQAAYPLLKAARGSIVVTTSICGLSNSLMGSLNMGWWLDR